MTQEGESVELDSLDLILTGNYPLVMSGNV